MEATTQRLSDAFEIIAKLFATNVWLGVGATVVFILGLVGLFIFTKKGKWEDRVRDGQSSVRESTREGTNTNNSVGSGDNWKPKP